MFDNYTDELQYSLKEQQRSDSARSTAPVRTHFDEISQKMPQGKNYEGFLSNTKNKSQLLKSSLNILHKKTHGKI